jgi:hypothetical protein
MTDLLTTAEGFANELHEAVDEINRLLAALADRRGDGVLLPQDRRQVLTEIIALWARACDLADQLREMGVEPAAAVPEHLRGLADWGEQYGLEFDLAAIGRGRGDHAGL